MTGHIIPHRARLPHGSACALPACDAARPVPPSGWADHALSRAVVRPRLPLRWRLRKSMRRFLRRIDGEANWTAAIFWGAALVLCIVFWAFIGGPALFWVFDMLAGWL